MKRKTKLVGGWGVNDVVYETRKNEWVCPYYAKWRGMIVRCFDLKLQDNHPTYKGCTVCDDWKYLSNFIEWVDSQPNKDWQNCELDKDILVRGNKQYSPDTCLFIPRSLNSFVNGNSKVRGDLMIGVSFIKRSKKNPYRTHCSDPLKTKSKYIGLFPTELEAHKAWQAKKHEYACMLADMQEDPRVADALRQRYAPDKDWTNY